MCIPIHSNVLQRDEQDESLASACGPSIQPGSCIVLEPPSGYPAVTGDERRPVAEEVLCNG
jgi:hypothetical protein